MEDGLIDALDGADDCAASMHSMMCVLRGYLHDAMDRSPVALNAMDAVESLHDTLYALARELAAGRKAALGGDGRVLIPQSML